MRKFIVLVCALAMAGPAIAHWEPGDGHKMHFPQLPDEDGWDVRASYLCLADDWVCSEDGYVKDIHFWGSWQEGNAGLITGL